MLTSAVRAALEQEARAMAGHAHSQYARQARQVFDQLAFPNGEIEVLGHLTCARSDILALAAWDASGINRVFGLDGGSSRAMVFRNGTVACANQAVLVSEHQFTLHQVPLEAHRTVAWVSHNRHPHALSSAQFERLPHNALWRLALTDDDIEASAGLQLIQELVKALADSASETQHALLMARQLPLTSGDLVFLDGGLYPTRLFRLLLNQGQGSAGKSVRLSASAADVKQFIQGSISLIELGAQAGFLSVAINKNPESRSLLRYGADSQTKSQWHNDRQWLSALFEPMPEHALGYTNWFVQHKHPFAQAGAPVARDLFAQLKNELTLGLCETHYHIGFFYVYDPRVRAAMRVEVPQELLHRHNPEMLQTTVLAHIARGGGGVPSAIRLADSEARISQQEREMFLNQCGITPDWHYNHSRGAPH